LGQAGAEEQRLHVWNGDWQVKMSENDHLLIAEKDGNRIELRLSPVKPPTAHGDSGLSRKGPAAGNASYYYSFTKMPTSGTVTCGGKSWKVTGSSWMDHEFSTSFLEPGQVGWDWFAIQLNNDYELMLYRMRRDDGSTDPFSSGSLVDPQGRVTHLDCSEFELVPRSHWTSPRSEGEYPLSWQISIPLLDCQLMVHGALQDQEMRTGDTTGITYWEGAIDVVGTLHGAKVNGVGYLELTGYAGRGLGSVTGGL
jgi:predicted secreted hydrolase